MSAMNRAARSKAKRGGEGWRKREVFEDKKKGGRGKREAKKKKLCIFY